MPDLRTRAAVTALVDPGELVISWETIPPNWSLFQMLLPEVEPRTWQAAPGDVLFVTLPNEPFCTAQIELVSAQAGRALLAETVQRGKTWSGVRTWIGK